MYLSEDFREILVDMVWNKLDCIETYDREDKSVVRQLEACLKELSTQGMNGTPQLRPSAAI
jgi:hypothetical protein